MKILQLQPHSHAPFFLFHFKRKKQNKLNFVKFDHFRGTLNFDEFQKGMTKVAEKKYEDEGIKGDKALSKLEQQIIDDNDVSDWIE